jgi:NitT/TauT family transport system permease protein
MTKKSSLVLPILFTVFILILWQNLIFFFKIPSYLLPSPREIILSLIKYRWDFLNASFVTFSITLIALFISAVLGTLISILMFFNKSIEKAISPYLILLQITPIIAIIPLLIIWFKSNTLVTLIICASVCSIFPIISSMSAGFAQTDKSLEMIFTVYKASQWKKLFKLYLPSALPFFLNGLQISSALALIGCVSAEFIAGTGGRNSGIAYQLLMAGYKLQTDKLFAALFAITLLGLILHFLFKYISHITLKKYR